MSEAVELVEAIALCQEDNVKKLIRQRLEAGAPPAEIVAECNRGMIELGNRFGREECFLPDLMFGGMIMKGVMAELEPKLAQTAAGPARAVAVMGTVQYDVHDIGKDIVVMMLRGAGFDVVDLGVDCPPAKFVEAVRSRRPAVMGMSLLLTTCFKSVQATVDAVKEAGLRENVSIMVGGAAASDLLREKTDCDFYGKSAVDGLKFACRAAGLE
jgi:methylmalonyl-CoA mutase cobalamin-binding domain/chain